MSPDEASRDTRLDGQKEDQSSRNCPHSRHQQGVGSWRDLRKMVQSPCLRRDRPAAEYSGQKTLAETRSVTARLYQNS